MVILFYINTIRGGGAARVMLRLAQHFSEAGYQSILVTSFVDADEYPVPDNVTRISIEQKQRSQSKLGRNISRIAALRNLCKKYRPAALISFMAEPNFRALVAAAGLPVKNIVSVRNDPAREYRGILGRFVGKYIIPRADGCVFQTDEAKRWFPEALQKRSRVIFNDVGRVFFETEYHGGKDIVALGRLCRQKNHALLISAFASIADAFPDTDLRIYGKGELEGALREQIRSCGLEARIRPMGSTDDVPAVLSAAGIFVLPSDYEGMPNALLEALAVGVPCISTDCPCGGPGTVIRDGENGLLIPVGDQEALTLALKKLLRCQDYAKKLGLAARSSAMAYQTDTVFQCWKEYVEGVINGEN